MLALKPPAASVVLTCDLIERGSAEECALLQQPLSPLICPVCLMPCNHDLVEPMRLAFPDHPKLEPVTDAVLSTFLLWVREEAGTQASPFCHLTAIT